MCYGRKTTVVEVEELVEVGDINQMHLSGVYIDYILLSEFEKRKAYSKGG